MLLPRETPFLEGLNSYYIDIGKFTEHLQGDLGSGCIHCKGTNQEILVYFDEHEIIRAVVQKSGEKARVSPVLEPVMEELNKKNYHISVNFLDPNAVYMWAQMPQFQRAKKVITSSEIALPDLIFRLRDKVFSGFIDVLLPDGKESALLFFHEGERAGGSYSWGRGGLNTSNDMYNALVVKAQQHEASFRLGSFIGDPESLTVEPEDKTTQEQPAAPKKQESKKTANMHFSDLETALEEFLQLYLQHMAKKTKSDPIVLLKQRFLDHMDTYPFLDPFSPNFDYVDNRVIIGKETPRAELAQAVVICASEVIEAHRQTKKFHATVKKWAYREALEERGIKVIV
jgi:hypothetical protein